MESLLRSLLRRPVASTAAFLLIAALAAAALVRLPVALLPSLGYPSLLVWTAYPDAAPEQVEQAVTVVVEQAVAATTGLLDLTSRSQLGGSLVRLDFGWNVDLDLAALDVRAKLDRLLEALPEEADRPMVLRFDPSERPILVAALAPSAGRSDPEAMVELERLARDVVARRLEQLDGVARTRITGGYEPEIEVWIDTDRTAAYNIDLETVAAALERSNVTLSGGVVRQGPFRFAVDVSGELRSIDEVLETVVSGPGRPPVRLADLARVQRGVAPRRGLVRLDGREVLLMLVDRRPDANTVDTAVEVDRTLAELRQELRGIDVRVVVDESSYILAAIAGVTRAVFVGGGLALAVLAVFLRRPRALMAVAFAVPLSLALTLVLFDLLGVTLNLISLSGLALGVGLLVDNSIVVAENVARLRDSGLDPHAAAARGTAEVAPAITASTLSTLAIFGPLSFAEGLAGRLFHDQSLAIVCSVSASLLMALSAVPLIASRDRQGFSGRSGGPLQDVYERTLDLCLRHRAAVAVAALGLLLGATWLARRLPREALPESRAERILLQVTLPPDSDLDLISERTGAIEKAAARLPGVRQVLADLGERDDARLELEPRPLYRADLTLILEPTANPEDLLRRIERLRLPPDMTIEARGVRSQLETLLSAWSRGDLVIDLWGEQRSRLEEAAAAFGEELRRCPELRNVTSIDPEAVPAYRLHFDREAMARFGVDPGAIESRLLASTRGLEATRMRGDQSDVPIVLHTPRPRSIEQLLAERLPVTDALLPLGTFLRAEPADLPAVLLRSRQTSALRWSADRASGVGLAQAEAAVRRAASSAPQGRVRIGGASAAFAEGLRSLTVCLLLSLLLVYLILAAQLESLTQPLIILLAVPMAGIGAVFALALTGQSWNLMSLTGLVVLAGVAVNDAILKVDLVSRYRREGWAIEPALREAGRQRWRPMLMTTLTTVCGLLPLSFGFGYGSRLEAPLAIALAGGLLAATAMTMLVLPAIYPATGSRSLPRHRGQDPP